MMKTHKQMLFVLAFGLAVFGHVICRVIPPVYVHKRRTVPRHSAPEIQAPTTPTLKVSSPGPLPAIIASFQNPPATIQATAATVKSASVSGLKGKQKPEGNPTTDPSPIRSPIDAVTTTNPASNTRPANSFTTKANPPKEALPKGTSEVGVKNKMPAAVSSASAKATTTAKSSSSSVSQATPPNATKVARATVARNTSAASAATTQAPTTKPPTTEQPTTTEPPETEGVEAEETEPTPGAGGEAAVTEAPEIEETEPTSGPEGPSVTEGTEAEETEGPTQGPEVEGEAPTQSQGSANPEASGLVLKAAGQAAIADASGKGKVQPGSADPAASAHEVEEPEATG